MQEHSERAQTSRRDVPNPVAPTDRASSLRDAPGTFLGTALLAATCGSERAAIAPQPTIDAMVADRTGAIERGRGMDDVRTATLAGGCFWCLEAVFEQLKGVRGIVSGYTGGTEPNPSYELVCTGTTGHAEAVQVTFDPMEITYAELLEVFFTVHDPTTPDRQGPDVGTQYRSAIFYASGEQRAVAEEVMRDIEARGVWERPIVTQLAPLETFYPAEGYHQGYYGRNAEQPYCRMVIAPKVAKTRAAFLAKLKRPDGDVTTTPDGPSEQAS